MSRSTTDRPGPGDPIEFIAPRTDAFGSADDPGFVELDGDDAGFDDEPSGPRWLAGLAGLAVVGLLAGGVVAAAPWSGDDATTAPTTTMPTSIPTTTVSASSRSADPVPGTTDDALLPDWLERTTGWLPTDDRSGFVVSSATSIVAADRSGDPFSLWMTEGATRTTGRWVAVDAVASTSELRRDASVIDVELPDGTWPAVVTVADDGVAGLTVDRSGSEQPSFTLTGGGWTLDELVELAAGMDVGPRAVVADTQLVIEGGLLDGLVEVFDGTTTARPESPVGGAERAVTWLVSDRTGSSANVSVSALTVPAMLLTDLFSRRPVDERSLRRTDRGRLSALAAGGRVVSLFELVRDPGVHGASWFDGQGNEVTVLTDAEIHQLVDLVVSLRPATEEEWTVAQLAQRIPSGDADMPTMIGGSIQDGWSVQVADRQMWLNAGDGFFADRWPDPGRRAGTVYANSTAAYVVLADTTRGDVDGRVATAALVEQGDRAQEVELVPLADGTRGAALPVDPRQPIRIRWLDPDGTVLNVSD